MEIERKYLVEKLPDGYENYPCKAIEQGYLCREPVVRVRKEDESYYLTYKGKGLLVREEYNLPLTREAYEHLVRKADGVVLKKRRYLIPVLGDGGLVVELDVFEGRFEGLILAEVEFDSVEEAEGFVPPEWFGRDVTFSGEYQNSVLSGMTGMGFQTGGKGDL